LAGHLKKGDGMGDKIIKGYKGFDKDMKCRGFQFEEGKEYETDNAVICHEGFHFCTDPFDVLNYYNIVDSTFAEVEALGKTVKHDEDSKVATTKIKISAKLSLRAFINAAVSFLLGKTKKDKQPIGDSSQLAASGDYSQLAASGDFSQLAASGYYSQLAASGDYSKLAASGDYSQLAASGDYSQLAASGDYSQLAASGHYSQLAASGHYSQLAASGDSSQLAASGHSSQLAASGHYSQLAASGDYSKLELNEVDSIGAAIGSDSTIKSKKGNWITLAEWKFDENKNRYVPICVKSIQVDGKKIKADTFYTLKNGKFVEVK
jgi:hypothetical protein